MIYEDNDFNRFLPRPISWEATKLRLKYSLLTALILEFVGVVAWKRYDVGFHVFFALFSYFYLTTPYFCESFGVDRFVKGFHVASTMILVYLLFMKKWSTTEAPLNDFFGPSKYYGWFAMEVLVICVGQVFWAHSYFINNYSVTSGKRKALLAISSLCILFFGTAVYLALVRRYLYEVFGNADAYINSIEWLWLQ